MDFSGVQALVAKMSQTNERQGKLKMGRTPGSTPKDVDKTTKKNTFVASLICLTFLLFLKEWSLQ